MMGVNGLTYKGTGKGIGKGMGMVNGIVQKGGDCNE